MRLILNAPNVHSGGGFSLLSAILEKLDEGFQGWALLDERMRISKSLPRKLVVQRTGPTILGRLKGEWCLHKLAGRDDLVLCFGNLPPLFRLRARVLLFIQNRYQIEGRSLDGFPLFARLRIGLERLWFAWAKRNVNHFIVQTPSMQISFQRFLRKPCVVLPFVQDPSGYSRGPFNSPTPSNGEVDFIYVASGEPHKNHRNLIEAWILLSQEGIRPKLFFTLEESRFPDLCAWIDNKKRSCDLNIENRANMCRNDLHELYRQASALIYPSDFESLGLPLIEARCAGLSILASERDYVRDVVDPEETFDPNSPVSIARAVKRFLEIPEKPLPVMDAREWLSKIYEIARQ